LKRKRIKEADPKRYLALINKLHKQNHKLMKTIRFHESGIPDRRGKCKDQEKIAAYTLYGRRRKDP